MMMRRGRLGLRRSRRRRRRGRRRWWCRKTSSRRYQTLDQYIMKSYTTPWEVLLSLCLVNIHETTPWAPLSFPDNTANTIRWHPIVCWIAIQHILSYRLPFGANAGFTQVLCFLHQCVQVKEAVKAYVTVADSELPDNQLHSRRAWCCRERQAANCSWWQPDWVWQRFSEIPYLLIRVHVLSLR